HVPAFRAVALFKGAVPASARDLLAGADVELRGGATWTLAALDTRARMVYADVAARFDATVATSFDARTGTIEVSIQTPPDLLGATEAQLRGLLPKSARAADVHVSFGTAPVSGNEHTRAGALTTSSAGDRCTTGFSVFSLASGTTGMLTAGHCSND